MGIISPVLLIITLNRSDLNSPVNGNRKTQWINSSNNNKTRQNYTLPTGYSLQLQVLRVEVKSWKKIFRASENKKKAGVAILMSDKIDFKTKTVRRG